MYKHCEDTRHFIARICVANVTFQSSNMLLFYYRIVQNSGGGNFGEFGKFREIRQSFTPPNVRTYIFKNWGWWITKKNSRNDNMLSVGIDINLYLVKQKPDLPDKSSPLICR